MYITKNSVQSNLSSRVGYSIKLDSECGWSSTSIADSSKCRTPSVTVSLWSNQDIYKLGLWRHRASFCSGDPWALRAKTIFTTPFITLSRAQHDPIVFLCNLEMAALAQMLYSSLWSTKWHSGWAQWNLYFNPHSIEKTRGYLWTYKGLWV